MSFNFYNNKQAQEVISSKNSNRGGSRAAATFKIERCVIIVNGLIYYHQVLHIAAAVDPPLFRKFAISHYVSPTAIFLRHHRKNTYD